MLAAKRHPMQQGRCFCVCEAEKRCLHMFLHNANTKSRSSYKLVLVLEFAIFALNLN